MYVLKEITFPKTQWKCSCGKVNKAERKTRHEKQIYAGCSKCRKIALIDLVKTEEKNVDFGLQNDLINLMRELEAKNKDKGYVIEAV